MKRAALLAVCLLALPLAARVRAVRSASDTRGEWLRANAIAVDAFDPGDASVVALGDVTHATHEVYAA